MFGISGAGTRAPDLGPMVTFGCYASSPPGGLAVVTLYGYADDPSAMPDPTIIEHEPTVVTLAERRTSGDVPIAVQLRRADVGGMNVTQPT